MTSRIWPGLSRWCLQGSVVAREDIEARFFERGDWHMIRVVSRDSGEIVAYVPSRGHDDPIAKAVCEALREGLPASGDVPMDYAAARALAAERRPS